MASSVSGQNESNPALLLATRAGKMELSSIENKTTQFMTVRQNSDQERTNQNARVCLKTTDLAI